MELTSKLCKGYIAIASVVLTLTVAGYLQTMVLLPHSLFQWVSLLWYSGGIVVILHIMLHVFVDQLHFSWICFASTVQKPHWKTCCQRNWQHTISKVWNLLINNCWL